jgi:hypothetical protein
MPKRCVIVYVAANKLKCNQRKLAGTGDRDEARRDSGQYTILRVVLPA